MTESVAKLRVELDTKDAETALDRLIAKAEKLREVLSGSTEVLFIDPERFRAR